MRVSLRLRSRLIATPQPGRRRSPSSGRPCTPASRLKARPPRFAARMSFTCSTRSAATAARGLVRAGKGLPGPFRAGEAAERREVPRRLFCLFFLLRALHGVPEGRDEALHRARARARQRLDAPAVAAPRASPPRRRRPRAQLHQFRPERRVGRIRHLRARRAAPRRRRRQGRRVGPSRRAVPRSPPRVSGSSQPRPARPRRRGSRAPPRWTAGGRTRAPSRVRRVRRTRRLARERGERARPFPGVDGPQRPARVHGRGTDLRVLQPDNELAECLVIQIKARRALRVPPAPRAQTRASAHPHREVNESTKRAQGLNVRRRRFRGDWAFGAEHDATRAQCHCPGRRSRVRNASRRALVVGDGAAPPRRGRRRRSRARARFRGPVASPRRARGANVPSVESRARGDGRDRRHAHRGPSRRAGLAPARETPARVANVGFPPLAATRPRPGSSRTRARVRGDPGPTRTTKEGRTFRALVWKNARVKNARAGRRSVSSWNSASRWRSCC